jgi:putative hemolysin
VPYLIELPWIGKHAQPISIGLVVILVTYISVVVGELVPKTLALSSPEKASLLVTPIISKFVKYASPIVRLLSSSTEKLMSCFGFQPQTEQNLTQDEIEIVIDQGAKSGALNDAEHQIVDRVLRLSDRVVQTVMTQRKDVVWINISDSREAILDKIKSAPHSYFPLCDGEIDSVVGLVKTRDVLYRLGIMNENSQVELPQAQDSGKKDLITGSSLKQDCLQPLFVPDTLPALRLLEQFREKEMHIAIVLDEYGSFEGLITSHDMLEAIVGELSCKSTSHEPTVVERGDGSFLVDGKATTDELKELLGVAELYEEEEEEYHTLAGMILSLLGKIPSIADSVIWNGWRFEVVDMDDNRIDRVLVSRV